MTKKKIDIGRLYDQITLAVIRLKTKTADLACAQERATGPGAVMQEERDLKLAEKNLYRLIRKLGVGR